MATYNQNIQIKKQFTLDPAAFFWEEKEAGNFGTGITKLCDKYLPLPDKKWGGMLVIDIIEFPYGVTIDEALFRDGMDGVNFNITAKRNTTPFDVYSYKSILNNDPIGANTLARILTNGLSGSTLVFGDISTSGSYLSGLYQGTIPNFITYADGAQGTFLINASYVVVEGTLPTLVMPNYTSSYNAQNTFDPSLGNSQFGLPGTTSSWNGTTFDLTTWYRLKVSGANLTNLCKVKIHKTLVKCACSSPNYWSVVNLLHQGDYLNLATC